MSADRRLMTPVAGTFAAAILVAAATFGGSLATKSAAAKSDRFAVMGDNLCAGQSWPNLTEECLAWSEGDPSAQPVRYVTFASTDVAAASTTLTRVRAASELH